MAGPCGRTYRMDPRLDPAACNALEQTASGLLVPRTAVTAGPGLRATAPAADACPQTWHLDVDAAWAQSHGETFTRTLTGADRAYVQVTEVPAVTIPRAGVYVVTYSVRGSVSLPAGTAGSIYVVSAIARNGATILTTEAMVVGITGTGAGAQGTGTMTFPLACAAGDVLTLLAYRIGQTGSAFVMSNVDGRTRVMAHWLAPVGDGGT